MAQDRFPFFRLEVGLVCFDFISFFFKRRKNCERLGNPSLKFICSFVFELSGFSSNAVVMEDDYPSELMRMIVAFEKRFPRNEKSPCIARKG